MSIVQSDLESGGYFAGVAPPSEYKTHLRRMLRITLLRPLFTRGRGELSTPKLEDDLTNLARLIEKAFPGDTRADHCMFYDVGGTVTIMEAAAAGANVVSRLADDLGRDLASTHRWHTIEPSLTRQGALAILHNLLRRGVQNAFRQASDDLPDVAVDREEDFATRMMRKESKCKEDASTPQHCLNIIQSLWASEPSDTLNSTMQHEDFRNHAVLDLTHPRGLLFKCQRRYFQMITDHADDPAPLSSLAYHF